MSIAKFSRPRLTGAKSFAPSTMTNSPAPSVTVSPSSVISASPRSSSRRTSKPSCRCAGTACEFGPEPIQRLNYALESSGEARNISARYEDGRVTVLLPGALAKRWVESDQVGLEGEQSLGGGGALKILVEKDFTCLTKRGGDEDADTFPHPQESMLCS